MTDLSSLRVQSMRNRVSNAEWQTRVDLAACYRLVNHFGMDDLMWPAMLRLLDRKNPGFRD